MKININWESWQIPYIFRLIQKTGNIDDEEMRAVFNLGIGLIIIVSKEHLDTTLNMLQSEHPTIIGEIVKE